MKNESKTEIKTRSVRISRESQTKIQEICKLKKWSNKTAMDIAIDELYCKLVKAR